MLVPWKALNGTHILKAQCTQGVERRRRRLSTEEEREVTARDFSAYGFPPGDGELLQIPRAGDLGNGRRLDGGGEELGPDEDGVEEDVTHPKQGGSDASGVRLIF